MRTIRCNKWCTPSTAMNCPIYFTENRYRRQGQAFPADAQIVRPRNAHLEKFKQGMLVCHQAFFPRHTLVEPYNLQYRFSADFDWCIRIMKKARTLHNTHLTIIDYLEEGMTTRNQKASLKERFRIMAKHYGLIGTVAHHAWFVIRAVTHQ